MAPAPAPGELVSRVAAVVNTHLHFDHCGGNRLFPGIPIHVQRRELADARTEDDYTVREWVDFRGATYVEHDGEAEILPGVRLLPAPGHTAGHQVVLVETDEGPVVLGGARAARAVAAARSRAARQGPQAVLLRKDADEVGAGDQPLGDEDLAQPRTALALLGERSSTEDCPSSPISTRS